MCGSCSIAVQIDDGVAAIGPPYEAGLDAWVNGEPINGADVVVWYGAHFTHDIGHESLANPGTVSVRRLLACIASALKRQRPEARFCQEDGRQRRARRLRERGRAATLP